VSPRYSTNKSPALPPVRLTLLRSRKAPNFLIVIVFGLYVPGVTIGITKIRRSSLPGGLSGGAVNGDLFKYCAAVIGCPLLSYTLVSGGKELGTSALA